MNRCTRYFAFTINNYSEEEENLIQKFAKSEYCLHLCYGREIAPTTGTKHLQGCFATKIKSRGSTVKKRIGLVNIHIEPCNKVYQANLNYCKKSKDTWEYPEKFILNAIKKIAKTAL